MTCANCGTENVDGAKFCNECAAPLVLLPPAREQRKTITVVFCDVTGSTASVPVQRVRLLGELALRVNDLEKMLAFYRDVVGLELWREYADCVFFRIADGVEGHPQVLVLFDRNVEVGRERSTIDHFAFVIGVEDYDVRRRQLERLGMQVRPKEFPRFHWRSLFIEDPEGNTVEFVCHDSSV